MATTLLLNTLLGTASITITITESGEARSCSYSAADNAVVLTEILLPITVGRAAFLTDSKDIHAFAELIQGKFSPAVAGSKPVYSNRLYYKTAGVDQVKRVANIAGKNIDADYNINADEVVLLPRPQHVLSYLEWLCFLRMDNKFLEEILYFRS